MRTTTASPVSPVSASLAVASFSRALSGRPAARSAGLPAFRALPTNSATRNVAFRASDVDTARQASRNRDVRPSASRTFSWNDSFASTTRSCVRSRGARSRSASTKASSRRRRPVGCWSAASSLASSSGLLGSPANVRSVAASSSRGASSSSWSCQFSTAMARASACAALSGSPRPRSCSFRSAMPAACVRFASKTVAKSSERSSSLFFFCEGSPLDEDDEAAKPASRTPRLSTTVRRAASSDASCSRCVHQERAKAETSRGCHHSGRRATALSAPRSTGGGSSTAGSTAVPKKASGSRPSAFILRRSAPSGMPIFSSLAYLAYRGSDRSAASGCWCRRATSSPTVDADAAATTRCGFEEEDGVSVVAR
mmetsp:Transcript_6156/g.19312  ORF Transcript_6156/g.19312 Transcript_6156/m.19312 type:complete len:369 (-) Transcript_6156:596-1702(-)